MKIAIFGGSFDPIHKGHISIAKETINELKLDKIFFVPAFISPFKNKSVRSSEDRLNMIKLVLEEKMEVSDFELKRKSTSYTFETVKYFKQKYPNDELFLIIGSDNLPKLNKWKNIDFIEQNIQIVVAKRSKNFNKINAKKYNAIILKNKIFEQSSTKYRSGNLSLVEKAVQDYIGKHNLYMKEIIDSTLSIKRARHCHYAGEFARQIAKANNLDHIKAATAANWHDICKELDREKHIKWIKNYMHKSVPEHEFHQNSGAIWLKHFYLMPDEEIIHAIQIHTTLSLELNWLDKVTYIADKICRGRAWEGIEKLRKLAMEDYEKAFKEIVKLTYKQLQLKDAYLTQEGREIYEKWSN